MNKPCCQFCLVGVESKFILGENAPWTDICRDPSCKCHLPKETCECAEPAPSHNGYCLKCMLWLPKQTPAPEKKWEEAFVEEWGMELPNLEIRKQVIAFIRQLLEEKAVEANVKLAVVRERLEYIASRNELHNGVCIPAAKEAIAIVSEAAAILRR